jgi:hypothetical protein
MDPRILFSLIIMALIVVFVLFAEALPALRRRRLRKQPNQQPPIYAVGSPEYNAQVISTIHKLNERLAPQGKRVPERAAIDIIQQVTDGYGKPEDHV